MDLPATQALDEDEFPATQQFATNEEEERTLVNRLLSYSRVFKYLTFRNHDLTAKKVILIHLYVCYRLGGNTAD